MLNILKKIIWWIWCLPQKLVALFLLIFCLITKKFAFTETVNGRIYFYINWYQGSVSLGNWIFLSKGHWNDDYVKKHEYGHTVQSLILGPLYLIVIGLPSYIWCMCFDGYRMKRKVSYYAFYPESWANKLGDKYFPVSH